MYRIDCNFVCSDPDLLVPVSAHRGRLRGRLRSCDRRRQAYAVDLGLYMRGHEFRVGLALGGRQGRCPGRLRCNQGGSLRRLATLAIDRDELWTDQPRQVPRQAGHDVRLHWQSPLLFGRMPDRLRFPQRPAHCLEDLAALDVRFDIVAAIATRRRRRCRRLTIDADDERRYEALLELGQVGCAGS